MKLPPLLALGITLLFLTGCEREADRIGSRESENTTDASRTPDTQTDYAEHLRAKALTLARAELARLSAAELLYHNKTYYYEYIIPTVITSGAYAKMYREFTGFRVADIRRSDSVLRPITMVIEFEYDVLGTEARIVEHPRTEAANTAQNNYDFRIYRQGTIRREYPCNENGDPLGGTARPLPRPNYWDEGDAGLRGEFTMEEVKTRGRK